MAESSTYDGFISYSHAADDLLAPRLQAGLQRFAKPWWKRRALRVFRDEASLSANPHLWSSITDALDGSEWFVLLLSEEAARSEWVNREVEYWLQHKDASRILPVVTDGEFSWANGDIDASSTAAPPALSGAFGEEPRWVDLRWARTDVHLDLNNPRFSDAVADIASAIRGIPKDELASEEVKQHRRTVRTAWAAGIVVLLLGIAATVGAIVAVGQSNEAEDQRDEAQRQAEIAQENAEEAERQEAEAQRQAEIAEEERRAALEAQTEAEAAAAAEAEARGLAEAQARVSRVRALASASVEAVGRDGDLALLLALAAAGVTMDAGEPLLPEAIDALQVALGGHRIDGRFGGGGGPGIAWSEDGGRLLVFPPGDTSHEATVWSTVESATVASLAGDSPVTGVAWSPSGHIAATTHRFGEVRLWSFGNADLVAILDSGRSAQSPVFGPAGRLLAVDEAGPLVRVWDLTATDEPLWVLELETETTPAGAVTVSGASGAMAFDRDGRLLAIAEQDTDSVSVWDMETGERVWSVPTPAGRVVDVAFDPVGSALATLQDAEGFGRLLLWDPVSRVQVGAFEVADEPAALAWSPDGGVVAAAGGGRIIELLDPWTGERLDELAGHAAGVTALGFGCRPAVSVPDTAGEDCVAAGSVSAGDPVFSLASTDAKGTALIWDLAPATRSAITVPSAEVVSATYVDGDSAALVAIADGELLVVDVSRPYEIRSRADGFRGTGLQQSRAGVPELIATPPVVVSADGSLAVAPLPTGLTALLDPLTPEEQLNIGIRIYVFALSPSGRLAAVEFPYRARTDGDLCRRICIPAVNGGEDLGVTFRRLNSGIPGAELVAAAFSPDETLVAVASRHREFRVYEVPSGPTPGVGPGDLDTAPLLVELPVAEGSAARVLSFSPDGSMLALGEASGRIRVLDATAAATGEPTVIADFTGIDSAATVMEFTPDGSLLGVAGIGTEVRFWSTATWTRAFSIDIGGQASTIDFSADGATMMAATGRSPRIVFYTVDLVDLLAQAKQRITRGFTEAECETYDMDPCPKSLQTIKNR